MKDFAISESPAVQAQLDRLGHLTVPQGRFGLETITALLARLGDPQNRLPPVFHVAGTNGKGSTCAFLRAMLEAQGLVVHAATKPHLVRYNERIRVAGRLIDDDWLAALLREVLDCSDDLDPSFFEVTAAATFLAFAHRPADACLIEVGLGGRLDATNVFPAPAVCGIAALGIDHESFLLRPEAGTPDDPLARIAFEKASIARAGSPLVTQAYPALAGSQVAAIAATAGAPHILQGRDWWAQASATGIAYRDRHGSLTLPLPVLAGAHQADNAALAVAMLRHQSVVIVSPDAMASGIRAARWPARLQRLSPGPLTALLPGRTIWLDGAHNANAAAALAVALADILSDGAPLALIFALMANRPLHDVLGALAPIVAEAHIVPIPGHAHHDPRAVADYASPALIPRAATAADIPAALRQIAANPDAPRTVLIAGSLYLAGEVLRLNGELPD
ncbi:MAG: bifunctional folylpolyglutamate synthase/dihydrofolate synthase [Pseudomonadota bacterium]|nr:bifunctional folylpolyglutamate synthase/dihydrofolate synthase [Pseudomonadota bacterium]